MKPYVVSHLTDELGNIKQRTQPSMVRRVAKEETIKKLMPVFEEVVSDSGTAGWATVEGLRIAGKTGTAQKYIGGRYTPNYRASFAGFFPVEDPKYVILVLLDEPKTSFYGGFTAGAVFREITTRIAGLDNSIRRSVSRGGQIAETNQYVVPQLVGHQLSSANSILEETNIRYKTTGNGSYVIDQNPGAAEKIERNSIVELVLGELLDNETPEGFVKLPDLRNMNMRKAVSIVRGLGLDVEMIGSGTIYNQFPLAGELMKEGRTITVRGRANSMQNVTLMAAQE